jgi:hypothetical protein
VERRERSRDLTSPLAGERRNLTREGTAQGGADELREEWQKGAADDGSQ